MKLTTVIAAKVAVAAEIIKIIILEISIMFKLVSQLRSTDIQMNILKILFILYFTNPHFGHACVIFSYLRFSHVPLEKDHHNEDHANIVGLNNYQITNAYRKQGESFFDTQ